MPQLGLYRDVNGPFFKGPVTAGQVADPPQMIMLSDARADRWSDASLDPTGSGEWPAKRHGDGANLVFVDGHTKTAIRKDIIDPRPNSRWRPCWNLDNQSHNEIGWTVNRTLKARLAD